MATDPHDGAQWLTTSQAAAVLGVAERTIQRRAQRGEIEARKAKTETGEQWEVRLSGANVPPGVAPGAANSGASFHAQNAGGGATFGEGGARVPPSGATSQDIEIISDLRDQVAFLRASVEQHQRSEAELRAALREALRAMPKQLTEGAPQSPPGGQGEPPTPKPDNTASDAPGARQRPANRDGHALTYSDIADELERNLNRQRMDG